MKISGNKRLIGLGILIILVLAAFFAFRSYSAKNVSVAVEPKRPVVSGIETAVLQVGSISDFSETSGTVKAKTISVLSAKIMGVVADVRVRQGERVSAGQLLISLDAEDIYRQMESAAHQKELADVTAERYRRLYAERAVARQQLDEVETRRKVADAEYARASANLAFARIISPTNGVVTDKRIDPGSMASPGSHLLTVEDVSAFSIETQADERLINQVVVGMPVEVAIDSMGRTVTGKVIEASPSVDSVSHTFYVKVEMTDPSLRSGLYAKVRFPLGQRQALVAPVESIVNKGQLSGVYIVDEKNLISYRLVKTGKTTGTGVEILSGLSAGESIVIKGAGKAVDGGRLGEVKQP